MNCFTKTEVTILTFENPFSFMQFLGDFALRNKKTSSSKTKFYTFTNLSKIDCSKYILDEYSLDQLNS